MEVWQSLYATLATGTDLVDTKDFIHDLRQICTVNEGMIGSRFIGRNIKTQPIIEIIFAWDAQEQAKMIKDLISGDSRVTDTSHCL